MKPASPSREGRVVALSCGIGAGLSALALIALAPACVGMHGQGGLDALSNTNDGKPIVEAFFEYPGPQDRWAGPSTLVVHVTARDGADPMITLSPGVFQPETGTVDFSSPMSAKRTGLTTSIVRERLALVATALTATGVREEPVSGCLSPVRARLIRSDGSLLEKRGCRSQQGWAFQAADAATDLITMAENGPPKAPTKLTAADMKAAEAKAASTPGSAHVAAGATTGAVAGAAKSAAAMEIAKDRKPADEHKATETAKSAEVSKHGEAAKSSTAKPAEAAKSAETTKPAAQQKPAEQPKAAEPIHQGSTDKPKADDQANHDTVTEKHH